MMLLNYLSNFGPTRTMNRKELTGKTTNYNTPEWLQEARIEYLKMFGRKIYWNKFDTKLEPKKLESIHGPNLELICFGDTD